MKIKLLLLFLSFVLIIQNTQAQSQGFYFSSITCSLQNESDRPFLINNELKIWKAAANGDVRMFDNASLDIEFKVKMSKAQTQDCFRDSFPTQSTTSHYGMILIANRSIDTCYIMSFSPMFSSPHKKWWDKTWPWTKDECVRYLTPLSEYPKVIPAKNMTRLHNICASQFSTLLGGKLSGDTIFRMVRFTGDSNEYLPHAPYSNLSKSLENEMLAGKLRAYWNKTLQKPMRKFEIEATLVSWDSTNLVEDPNNPGTFIMAPIKFEGQPESILVYEKWIPIAIQKAPGAGSWSPEPYIAYQREILAYGMLLTNRGIIWYSAKDANEVLIKDNFNMIPYAECFRAERFQTLKFLPQ